MLSLDANILVYAADKSAGLRHAMAAEIVQSAARANASLTEQALFEFFYASTRKAKMPFADALAIVRELTQNFSLLLPSRTIIDDTVALLSRHKLSIWDARLLAVCDAYGCDYLLSEDLQDGALYGMVRVINPFAQKNRTQIRELLGP